MAAFAAALALLVSSAATARAESVVVASVRVSSAPTPLSSAPWVPLPPPIECGDVLQPNNTVCIYLRNNCTDAASLHLTLASIPGNRWAVAPAKTFTNGTWFSFPSLSLAPNGTKGFAEFTANVFYNATLTTGEQHEFGLGCIFGSEGYDCSFQPGKHFDADPDMQVEPAPSYVALLIFHKKKT